MDTLPPQLLLLILGILLVLALLTNLAQAASVNISDARLKQLAEEDDKRAKKLQRLLEINAMGFMGGMELATGFVAMLISGFAAVSWGSTLWEWSIRHGLNTLQPMLAHVLIVLAVELVMAIVYQILGVFFPKRMAAKYAEKLALSLVGYTRVVCGVCAPFLWITTAFANGIARIFGVRAHDLEEEVTEEEIRMMVDIGSESGVIDDDEKQMIHNIFELDDKPVEEIMTHRTEACVLWLEDSLEEWKQYIDETNHTRYPVCHEDIDNVVGVVNSRDFYRFMLKPYQEDVKTILRSPYFVPDTMKADELFSRMQQKNTHLAVVLDEYGGFLGLVTQEDLLEEIVGELYSEYDEPEEQEIVQVDENTWKIAGSTEIEDVEEALGIQIPEGDYNTFAGMILDALGTVPDDGSTVELEANNMQIKVTAVAEHRIEEAVVCLIGGVEEEAAEKAKEEESAKEDRMQARDQANENMNS